MANTWIAKDDYGDIIAEFRSVDFDALALWERAYGDVRVYDKTDDMRLVCVVVEDDGIPRVMPSFTFDLSKRR